MDLLNKFGLQLKAIAKCLFSYPYNWYTAPALSLFNVTFKGLILTFRVLP